MLIGTYTPPTPAMPEPNQVTSAAVPAPTGIPLEPNSYTLLRIGGTLHAVRNPYIGGTLPGEGAITYTAVQSSESTGRGATYTWLLGPGSWVPPEGGEHLTGYFRPASDGRDLILLVRTRATGGELWAGRDKLPGRQRPGGYCVPGAPYCGLSSGDIAKPDSDGGAYIEDYWLTQPHTITATRVPEPLTVEGPDAVPPGSAAAFTAAPWGELRLRDPVGIAPRVWWIWYPNDTTAAPNFNVRPEVLSCRGPSCSFIPAQSGRMRVTTYVEGAYVDAYSEILRVEQQKLELTCSRYRVDRGQSIDCSAAAKPSGTLDSIRWQFVDTAGHVIDSAGPAAWGGEMVVGGRITVQAVLNGVAVAQDTVLVVARRRWPRPTVRAHEELATDLPLPNNVSAPHDLGDSHVDSLPNPSLTTRRVGTGPNTGWWYIPDHIREIPVTVHINEAAFLTGSAWYNLQIGGPWKDPQTGITHPNGYCTQSQVPTLRRLTREHEGSLSSSLTSHVDAMRVYIANNAPQDSMEAVIAWDADVQTFPFHQTVRSWYRAYIRGNLTGFSAPHKPTGIVDLAPFPCAARPWR